MQQEGPRNILRASSADSTKLLRENMNFSSLFLYTDIVRARM